MKITLIGAGNVAWHLGFALENHGHGVEEVYSRDPHKAKDLAMRLYNARASKSLNFARSKAEVFIMAVTDDAIGEVLTQLVLPPNAILVHTSGSKPLAVLQRWAEVYSDVAVSVGVFYPLQTFSKNTQIDFEEIPLCIEASDEPTEQKLVSVAQDLSEIVYVVDSAERQVLHLGAVFACNFTNYLFTLSKELLEDAHLDMVLLKPLIRETIRKALLVADPATVQTGPARRGDRKTIQQHLDYLKDNPEAKVIYRLLSEGILHRYDHT